MIKGDWYYCDHCRRMMGRVSNPNFVPYMTPADDYEGEYCSSACVLAKLREKGLDKKAVALKRYA